MRLSMLTPLCYDVMIMLADSILLLILSVSWGEMSLVSIKMGVGSAAPVCSKNAVTKKIWLHIIFVNLPKLFLDSFSISFSQ